MYRTRVKQPSKPSTRNPSLTSPTLQPPQPQLPVDPTWGVHHHTSSDEEPTEETDYGIPITNHAIITTNKTGRNDARSHTPTNTRTSSRPTANVGLASLPYGSSKKTIPQHLSSSSKLTNRQFAATKGVKPTPIKHEPTPEPTHTPAQIKELLKRQNGTTHQHHSQKKTRTQTSTNQTTPNHSTTTAAYSTLIPTDATSSTDTSIPVTHTSSNKRGRTTLNSSSAVSTATHLPADSLASIPPPPTLEPQPPLMPAMQRSSSALKLKRPPPESSTTIAPTAASSSTSTDIPITHVPSTRKIKIHAPLARSPVDSNSQSSTSDSSNDESPASAADTPTPKSSEAVTPTKPSSVITTIEPSSSAMTTRRSSKELVSTSSTASNQNAKQLFKDTHPQLSSSSGSTPNPHRPTSLQSVITHAFDVAISSRGVGASVASLQSDATPTTKPAAGPKPRMSARDHLSPPAVTNSLQANTIPTSTTHAPLKLPTGSASKHLLQPPPIKIPSRSSSSAPSPQPPAPTTRAEAAKKKRHAESQGKDMDNPIQIDDDDAISTPLSQRTSSSQTGLLGPKSSPALINSTQQNKFHLIYPKEGRDQVVITDNDLFYLKPGGFLNDSIVDFYLKYLMNNLDPNLKEHFYCLNSFFYKKWILAEESAFEKSTPVGKPNSKAYEAVSRWTKGVNVFEKDFIIVPINVDVHWSLAIICYPAKFFQPPRSSSTIDSRIRAKSQAGPAKRPLPPPTPTAPKPGVVSQLLRGISSGISSMFGSSKASTSPDLVDQIEDADDKEWDPFGDQPTKKQKIIHLNGEHKSSERVFSLDDDGDNAMTDVTPAQSRQFVEEQKQHQRKMSSSTNTSPTSSIELEDTDPTHLPAILYLDSLLAPPQRLYLQLSTWLKEEWKAKYPPPPSTTAASSKANSTNASSSPHLTPSPQPPPSDSLAGRRATYVWHQPPYFGATKPSRPKNEKLIYANGADSSPFSQREPKDHYANDEPFYVLFVPEQKNGCDCGLYLLEYTELFIKNNDGPKLLSDHIRMIQQRLANHLPLSPPPTAKKGGKSQPNPYLFEYVFLQKWKSIPGQHNMNKKRKHIEQILQAEHEKATVDSMKNKYKNFLMQNGTNGGGGSNTMVNHSLQSSHRPSLPSTTPPTATTSIFSPPINLSSVGILSSSPNSDSDSTTSTTSPAPTTNKTIFPPLDDPMDEADELIIPDSQPTASNGSQDTSFSLSPHLDEDEA